jgi:copper homeostasis protein (lipoprotein)
MRMLCCLVFASMLVAATPSPAPPTTPGVYRVQLPCADCSGIILTLRLNANGTYSGRYVYVGRSSSYVEHGTWKLDPTTQMLALQPYGGSASSLRESSLARVTPSPTQPTLEATSWSLATLEGKQVTVAAGHEAPSMTFSKEDSRVYGTGGCNNFTGSFATTGSGGLTLSQVASTRMFCIHDMETEDRYFAIFDKVRGYRISGGALYLTAEGGATLATLTPNP